MSRKRGRRVEPGHLVEHKRDASREREILNSQIYKDPKIQEILTKMVDASELEAVDLALQLQKVARGAASLLENPELGGVVSKMREEAANRDRAAAAFEADKEGFINGLFEKGERIKKTGAAAERTKANASNMFSIAVQDARVTQKLKRKRLEEELKTAPTERIVIQGVPTMLGGSRTGQWEIFPEELKIGHLTWRLMPGEHEVPKPVAEVYRQKLRARAERSERSKVMSQIGEAGAVSRAWDGINRKYNSGGDPFIPG